MRVWFRTAKEDGCRWFITDKNGHRVFLLWSVTRTDDPDSTARLLEFVLLRWRLIFGWNRKEHQPTADAGKGEMG